jgi:hypothetical protein
MASGDSALTVCSDALVLIGAEPISSFSEGTDAANTCDRIYPDIRDQALQSYPWAFSFRKSVCARLVTTPVNEFKYEYQLPGDKLGPPRKVFNTESYNAHPIQSYRILGNKLMTNEETIYVDYQYSVPEYEMPVYFIQLLKYLMAWHLCIPITDQSEKAVHWERIAVGSQGENNRGGYFRTAMNIDGQGQPVSSIEDYSLVAVRF